MYRFTKLFLLQEAKCDKWIKEFLNCGLIRHINDWYKNLNNSRKSPLAIVKYSSHIFWHKFGIINLLLLNMMDYLTPCSFCYNNS